MSRRILFKGETLGTDNLALDNQKVRPIGMNIQNDGDVRSNSPVYDDKILERQLYMHFGVPYWSTE